MDHPLKVLLANRPRALRTRLEELLQNQSDVEVSGIILDPIKLLMAIEDTQADVVIVTLPSSGKMPAICSHLLYEYPQLLILALSSDCMKARIYRQTITVEQLSDTSDAGILLAIRMAKANNTS
jgi:DNA-binding NarL/FixJ family response regulator